MSRAWLWKFLGKDPEAIIVHFGAGPAERVRAMYEEVRRLEPAREHRVAMIGPAIDGLPCISLAPGSPWQLRRQLRRALGRSRIGLAPVLIGGDPHPLRAAAAISAPHKLLAFNPRGERHHLSLRTPIASALFLHGLPFDRIWLRPCWWPWARERSRAAQYMATLTGRALGNRPRIAIVSPYFPWPLSHGGAVRIYNLLREASRNFDLFLYCITETDVSPSPSPVLDIAHRVTLFRQPRYVEPRWASLLPPEVREFQSAAIAQSLVRDHAEFGFVLIQAEYTALASYTSDVLVEHDITFDLYEQIYRREPGLSTWWDLFRWRRFERRATERVRRVAVMAAKDAALLPRANTVVIPNGVDLGRFKPVPEPDAARVLFVGSFRHFPNVTAYRFLQEEVWPLVRERCPHAELEVVAGPDHLRFLPEAAVAGPGVTVHGFVADVVPLYQRANVVVSPTLVSAGTNLKVLEAMAMRRAVVSTPSGCAGLMLRHSESAWIAESAEAFAGGVVRLLTRPDVRQTLAANARRIAEEHFDWGAIGRMQAALWQEWAG